MRLLSTVLSLGFLSTARAVTVYGQIPIAQTSATSQAAPPPPTPSVVGSAIKNAAYDTTILNPPAVPQQQGLNYTINLNPNNASVANLSIMQHGSFYGFSVEMSVVTQISECYF